MDSNTLNAGLKKEPQVFLSSSLETRATAKVNFGDVESFEQNNLRLQNDQFEELDTIPTVAKTLLQNGETESLKKGTNETERQKKGTDENDDNAMRISNEKLFNARVQKL